MADRPGGRDSWLDWYDAALELPKELSWGSLAAFNITRLHELRTGAQMARLRPRRLGQDATREQLAADKWASRAVEHGAEQARASWMRVAVGVVTAQDVADAPSYVHEWVLDGLALWDHVANEQIDVVHRMMARVATFGVRQTGFRVEMSGVNPHPDSRQLAARLWGLLHTERALWLRVLQQLEVRSRV